MTRRTIVPATLLAVLTVGTLAAAPASAAAASPESQPLQRMAAPWCGATIWRSGLWKKAPLLQRYKKILEIADTVDRASDVAALVLAALSVGSLTAPAAAVKLVAKYGKWSHAWPSQVP